MTVPYQPRVLDKVIPELLEGLSSLLVVGPRATGKTTTVSRLASTVIPLDDSVRSAAFRNDPDMALRGLTEPVLLDEWQDAPNVLGAVKRSLDADPHPGRYLLTGSVNADLEAQTWPGTGRLVRLAMYGMTVAEQRGQTTTAFLDRIGDGQKLVVPADVPDLRGYVELALRSGFPEAHSPAMTTMHRERWLESYVDELVTRDARKTGGARDPVLLRRYLHAYALNSAGTIEHKRLHDAAGISQLTGRDYQQLLLNLWAIENLPAWASNRFKRLVRSPKRYVVDAGLLSGILRLGVEDVLRDQTILGRVVDTFIASQLRAETAWARSRPQLYHVREQDGRREIDLVAELRGQRIIAVEAKATAAPDRSAAKHLIWFRDELGDRFVRGIVFHTGPRVYDLDDRITAAPIATLWG